MSPDAEGEMHRQEIYERERKIGLVQRVETLSPVSTTEFSMARTFPASPQNHPSLRKRSQMAPHLLLQAISRRSGRASERSAIMIQHYKQRSYFLLRLMEPFL